MNQVEVMNHSDFSTMLYVFLITAVLCIRITAASMCPLKPCINCEASCPPLSKQRDDYNECFGKLTKARSAYVSDATLDCKMTACARRLLESACGFVPSPVPQNRNMLLQKLDQIRQYEEARKDRLDQKAADILESVSAEERAYYNEATTSFLSITRNFLSALATRTHAFLQDEYILSGEFRDVQQEVAKLRLENDARRLQVEYWKQWNKTISNAVHTSPIALQRLRDQIRNELKSVEEEVALINALQLQGLSAEQRIAFIYHLKDLMTTQLHRILTQTAQLRQELSFLQEGRTDLLTMLNNVLDDVRRNNSIVPCGALALSDIVTDTIAESTQTTTT